MDGTRWWTFMRLLRLDDLMTSYTNARPGAGLLVLDLDLGTASGRLAARRRTSPLLVRKFRGPLERLLAVAGGPA
jgi:hypothetical protein